MQRGPPGKRELMEFTLLTLPSKQDRDEVLRRIQRSQMHGMRGSVLRAKRNVAKWQREGGQFLRMLMACRKAVEGDFTPDILWDEDAFSIRGQK
eukprot:179743-Alexandrium_andersonii.AAC.1